VVALIDGGLDPSGLVAQASDGRRRGDAYAIAFV
jgi:hypothetical protein